MTIRFFSRYWRGVIMVLLLEPIALAMGATPISLEPPESGGYILDHARLITDKGEREIHALADAFHTEQNIPLVVITIDSMDDHSRFRYDIETFARKLFNQWGRDPQFALRDSWRRGVMLLVSKNDRKARIELGFDWAGRYNVQCQRIMDQLIVPEFREKRYSTGVLQGVIGVRAMSRGKELPKWSSEDIRAVLGIGALLGGLSLLILIGHMIESRLPSGQCGRYQRDHDYGSSSYGGGSSSGSDYGGGGGATGSW